MKANLNGVVVEDRAVGDRRPVWYLWL